MDEHTRIRAKKYVNSVAKSVSRAFKAKAEVEFKENAYPVTVNDPSVTNKAMRILRTIGGTRTVVCKPIMGAEDFSRFLQKAPGTFYFLGTLNAKKGCTNTNHSSNFKVDESVLKYGTLSLARLAYEFGKSNAIG
jgi:carboxypeptidase Ss1